MRARTPTLCSTSGSFNAGAGGASAVGVTDSSLNTLGPRVWGSSRDSDSLGVSRGISVLPASGCLRRTTTDVSVSSEWAVGGTEKKASAASRAALGGHGASKPPRPLKSSSNIIG